MPEPLQQFHGKTGCEEMNVCPLPGALALVDVQVIVVAAADEYAALLPANSGASPEWSACRWVSSTSVSSCRTFSSRRRRPAPACTVLPEPVSMRRTGLFP